MSQNYSVQIQIAVPLSIEEIKIGERYMDYIINTDLIRSSHENAAKNIQIENETHYYLSQSLPHYIREIINQASLVIIEQKQYQPNGLSVSLYTCQNFPTFKAQCQSELVEGEFQDIQLQKFDQLFKVDAINDQLQYFKGYQNEIVDNLQKNFKLGNLAQWKKQTPKLNSIIKTVHMIVPYGEAKEQIQEAIVDGLRRFMLYYYKCMLITYTKWIGLSLDVIKLKQQQLFSKQLHLEKYRQFNDIIYNYQDLVQKTNYLDVKNKKMRKGSDARQELGDTQSVISQSKVMNLQRKFHDNQSETLSQNFLMNSKNKVNKQNFYQKNDDNQSQSSEIVIKKNILSQKKAGFVLKKGDGPIDYGWNQRYLVLNSETLMYFKHQYEKAPKGFLSLKQCFVSNIMQMEGRDYVFYVESSSPPKKYYFSFESKLETEQWRDEIMRAVQNNKENHGSSLGVSPKKTLKNDLQKEQIKQEDLINKQKYDTIRSKFQRNQFSENVSSHQRIVSELHSKLNDPKFWILTKFRNGVRVFERVNPKQSSGALSAVKKVARLCVVTGAGGSVFAVPQEYLSSLTGVYESLIGRGSQFELGQVEIVVRLVLSLVILLLSLVLTRGKQAAVECEIAGKILIEEDATNIFQNVKKNAFKQSIDFHLTHFTKSTETQYGKESVFTYLFEKNPGNSAKQSSGHSSIQIQTKTHKTRFILGSDCYYIIYESNSISKGILFKLLEIFLIERQPKISGKCHIYYYSSIRSDQFNYAGLQRMLHKRAQQLAVIRETIQDVRIKQVTMEVMNENQINLELIRSSSHNFQHNPQQAKDINLLEPSNVLTSPVKSQIFIENNQEAQNQFSRDAFADQIKKVELLKKGHIKMLQKTTLEQRKLGYQRVKEGGIGCFNREEIKNQEGLVLDLMKQAGKQLMSGQNVVAISLPVRIFEPRSTLERITDNWAFMPIYLKMAAQTKDQLERFKLVVTFVMSGLYNSTKQQKPFNPILGETFQGFWPDGTKIDIEHTSHHPPICNFMVQDTEKKFKFFGHYEFKAKLMYNGVTGQQDGGNYVEFYDGQKIRWVMPPSQITGLLYGTRVQQFYGQIVFEDLKNGFHLTLKFYEYGFFQKDHPSDWFSGNIILKNQPAKIFSRVQGSWLEFIEFDQIRYWDLDYIDPSPLIPIGQPLPSDCRFREDLLYLAQKDLNMSQQQKIRLEVLQRADRALRAKNQKKTKEQENK